MRLLAAALILFAAAAAAEHEADHRYDIKGYVLGADKRPIEGELVTIQLGAELLGSGRTDGDGYYSIRLHLHDSDIGGRLAVRAGRREALIRMQAEHGDRSKERVHHLNFVGSEVIEKSLSGTIPGWVWFVSALLALWAAALLASALWKKLRKLRAAPAPHKRKR